MSVSMTAAMLTLLSLVVFFIAVVVGTIYEWQEPIQTHVNNVVCGAGVAFLICGALWLAT